MWRRKPRSVVHYTSDGGVILVENDTKNPDVVLKRVGEPYSSVDHARMLKYLSLAECEISSEGLWHIQYATGKDDPTRRGEEDFPVTVRGKDPAPFVEFIRVLLRDNPRSVMPWQVDKFLTREINKKYIVQYAAYLNMEGVLACAEDLNMDAGQITAAYAMLYE